MPRVGHAGNGKGRDAAAISRRKENNKLRGNTHDRNERRNHHNKRLFLFISVKHLIQ
jgi:hypothetical protein